MKAKNKTIICDIVSENGVHNRGPIFEFKGKTFDEFVDLVCRTSPGFIEKQILPGLMVIFKFEDRAEIYTLEPWPKKPDEKPLLNKYIDRIKMFIKRQEQDEIPKDVLFEFLENIFKKEEG